ncbi:hypothetical protein KIN20_015747 [Parelaphostrongylus tenuis]|uniref:Uncharacterized protein n=1 Tax=Parelaphostrongylus tenuis TaxID=148309 RepID=A0AAD5MFE7_PARTN|nr:hypothetical protein KIN20_015747 [Parelaphostrongylus tenuis]
MFWNDWRLCGIITKTSTFAAMTFSPVDKSNEQVSVAHEMETYGMPLQTMPSIVTKDIEHDKTT